MNAVYIVGNRSAWNDNEIKFSLRSLEKHFPEVTNVFIVGHKPAFLNSEIGHVPYEDGYFNTARNIAKKICTFCLLGPSEDTFLLMADDYYFLKPFDFTKYHYKGTLRDVINRHHGVFVYHALATEKALKENLCTTYNFDCHYPMIIDTGKFISVYGQYNWADLPYGYTIKSLYANTIKVPFCDMKAVGEVKVRFAKEVGFVSKWIKDKDLFSSGESFGAIPGIMEFMEELYPNKSKFER